MHVTIFQSDKVSTHKDDVQLCGILSISFNTLIDFAINKLTITQNSKLLDANWLV